MAVLGTVLGGNRPELLSRYDVDESNIGSLGPSEVDPQAGSPAAAPGAASGLRTKPQMSIPHTPGQNTSTVVEGAGQQQAQSAQIATASTGGIQRKFTTGTAQPYVNGNAANGNSVPDTYSTDTPLVDDTYSTDQPLVQQDNIEMSQDAPVGMSMTKKLLIGAGVLAVLGTIGYVVYRKFKKPPMEGLDDVDLGADPEDDFTDPMLEGEDCGCGE